MRAWPNTAIAMLETQARYRGPERRHRNNQPVIAS
jgi:hypothetical protein